MWYVYFFYLQNLPFSKEKNKSSKRKRVCVLHDMPLDNKYVYTVYNEKLKNYKRFLICCALVGRVISVILPVDHIRCTADLLYNWVTHLSICPHFFICNSNLLASILLSHAIVLINFQSPILSLEYHLLLCSASLLSMSLVLPT